MPFTFRTHTYAFVLPAFLFLCFVIFPLSSHAVVNENFDWSFSNGVADGWNAWETTGSGTGQYKSSTGVGRIGGGIYGNNNNPANAVIAMNGKTCLIMETELSMLPTLRASMPDTIFVGRIFIDHLTNTYLSDPEYYGRQFADICASKSPQPDVWMGMNEIGGASTQFKKVARFEKAFTERLHELGLQSCVLGLAVGNPGDMSYMEFQEVRDCLAIADYAGYHCYGSQAEQLMGGVNQQGTDYPWYALRWRMYRNTYDQNGWRMPPVIYTEGTTWAGWKGYYSAQQVLDDLEWMSVEMISDPWSLGICIFLSGHNGDPQWFGWEVANEPTIYNGATPINALYPTDAKTGTAQIFGNDGTNVWTGGINQAVSTTSGHQYDFTVNYKWEYYTGGRPDVGVRLGWDPTGQTTNGNASTINWSSDVNNGIQDIHQTWMETGMTFTATSGTTSIWVEGSQPDAAPRWRLCVDDVELEDITGGPTATPTPVPTNTPTPTPTSSGSGTCSSEYTWNSGADPSEVDSIVESSGGWGGSNPATFSAGQSRDGHVALSVTQDYGASYWVWNFTGLDPNQVVDVDLDVHVDCANNSSWFEVYWAGGAHTAQDGKSVMGSVKAKWDSNGNGNGTSSGGWTTIGDTSASTDGSGNFTVAVEFGHWSSSPATVTQFIDNLQVCTTGSAPPTATPTPTAGPTATPTPTPSVIAGEDFETMPSWDSTFNASWGGAATWSIVGGGQSGNALEVYRGNDGSSARAEVYTVPQNTNIDVSVYMRSGSGTGYWAEAGYRLGSHTAQDFDQNGGSWTLIQKFSNGGTNGNNNTWTKYTKTVNTGSNTQISIGYKLGRSGGSAPTVQWDTFRIE